jgi:transposase
MVFGVVSNEGHVMPPYFFPQGLRINALAYKEVLKTVVKPWIDSIRNGRPYVFQQDSAPSHKAKLTQEWMAENFHDHITPNIWPPNSPDLNPLDYYVWSVVEREVNEHPHTTKESLKAAILRIMTNINKDHLIKACKRFRSRIEAVIAAEGDFIE